jgi:hypothetical protein
MDPVTIKVASSIAGRLAGATLKPVGRKARDIVLGPPERTAAEHAIRAAIGRAVDEVSGQGLDEDTVQHVLLMFEHLFMRHYRDEAIIAHASSEEALTYWRLAAEAAGWDLVTFPLHFSQVVEQIMEHLPAALREEAANSKSPLFNRVTVTMLADLESRLTNVLEMTATALSYTIPLSKPLERLLDGVLEAARATDCAIITPDLLLALLRMPDPLIREAFDSTRQRLAREIEDALSRYLASAPLDRFADFDWRERRDVQAAQVVAARCMSPVVTERHLLIGILEAPSNTQQQLVAWLGAEIVGKAKEAALQLRSSAEGISTGGKVFPAVGDA